MVGARLLVHVAVWAGVSVGMDETPAVSMKIAVD
jgi:hypothetical protein